ncbi:MAG: MlaE family lipid ABC transporter permease subunit [Hyphomicrobiales bacterium]
MSSAPLELDASAPPRLSLEGGGDALRAALSGRWTAEQAPAIERCMVSLLARSGSQGRVSVDLSRVERLDTVGAWVLERTLRGIRASGGQTEIFHARAEHAAILGEVALHGLRTPSQSRHGYNRMPLVEVGRDVVGISRDLVAGLSFFGEVVFTALRTLEWKRHFRAPAFIHQMELITLRGVPIIVLISFLVGGIIAQQGIFQLRRFGAEDFVVDLVGILTLRELGVLLTAIMVAGRSGSSFTAELGAMKMREEIDALKVMGFDPIDVLIIPRLLALTVGLPMLTFLADLASLAGGGLVAFLYGGMGPHAFLSKLQLAIGMPTFLVGLIKAPFMALVVGLIASIEGLRVEGSTEALGHRVTSSVVKSIFMVIVMDGLFAMFFAAIDY